MTSPALTILDRRHLQEALAAIDDQATAVVLVGSRARGVGDDTSDIDLLVIGSGRLPRPGGRVQIIQTSEIELMERLKTGDDFAAWAIRYGKPIRGRSRWRELRSRLSAVQRWPDPELKQQKAAAHWKRAVSLRDLGDEDAAEDEARIALSHLARALLLERGVFPLSRPELAGQLEEIGEVGLAEALTSTTLPLDELLPMLRSHLEV